jgi:hypothetical protein
MGDASIIRGMPAWSDRRDVRALSAFKTDPLRADDTLVMQPHARHDLRHPIATMFLIGSTAHAFAGEPVGSDEGILLRCRDEMVEELGRFRARVRVHGMTIDDAPLAAAVESFAQNPRDAAGCLAVQDACRAVLAQLGQAASEPESASAADLNGVHALEA